jgi:pyridoxal phosphate enzyme (YggS family)
MRGEKTRSRYEVESLLGSREACAVRTSDQPLGACAIKERYLSIKERVWRAAQHKGREPASVKLVAVTKTFGEEDILPVLDEGHRVFGENRVQEAIRKWPPLRERFPGIELHLIGPLQSNKAREAVSHFDCIETVDRPRIAAALAAEVQRQGRAPKFLVQVNIGHESQKAGVSPEEAGNFVAQCRREFGLSIEGLMCVPPVGEDPVPHFQTLAALQERLELPDLSMGMSGDFEEAILHGATLVRVGSAIFGAR